MDPQMGPKILQKSALGRPGPPRDANGRPEASIKLFWSLLEQMFVPPGSNYGTIWVSFGHFHHSSFFPCSGPRFGCIPANQGRRVPALALTIMYL